MSENKSFKQFRHALHENEYSEVLTGYPNRSIAPCGAIKHDADFLGRVNAMLNAIGRSTFMHPNDAFIKIKTRLNLLMLDFPWTPYLWQDSGVGVTTLTVTRYGRVDGVDALTGAVRTDGKANSPDGFKEFILTATIERAEDGLFRVTAKLSPKEEVQVEESWGGGFETSREAWARLAKQERAEAKRAREAKKAKEKAAAKAAKAKKTVKEGLVGGQHKLDVNKNKRLDSQDFKLLRAKKKAVKEEAEVVEEMHKDGSTVKVPHKGKMVKGRIVRYDSGGTGKAQQHGGGYVVDVGEYSSIIVPHHKIVKEEAEVVEEGKTAKIRRLQNRLGYKAANIRSGYAKDTPEAQAKIKKMQGVVSKLSGEQKKTNQRRAEAKFPHSDPKIAKMDWDQRSRVRGGSARAAAVQRAARMQKEDANLEFTTGLPLQVPPPGENIAGPVGKGKRLHKKAK